MGRQQAASCVDGQLWAVHLDTQMRYENNAQDSHRLALLARLNTLENTCNGSWSMPGFHSRDKQSWQEPLRLSLCTALPWDVVVGGSLHFHLRNTHEPVWERLSAGQHAVS